MNHSTNSNAELDQIDDDVLDEVSDETLEAAGADIGGQALESGLGMVEGGLKRDNGDDLKGVKRIE